jgi:hypothetical protein
LHGALCLSQKITQEDVETANKAVQMSQNSAPELHTLGCIYAEIGKTKDAREVLVPGGTPSGISKSARVLANHRCRRLAGNSEVVLGRKLNLAGWIRGIGTAENWRCERAYIILVIRMVEGIENVNAKLQLGDTGLRLRTKSR